MQIRFDTEGVLALATTLDTAQLDGAAVSAEVDVGLDLAQLESDVAVRLLQLLEPWTQAAIILRFASAQISEAELDLEAVAAELGVPVAELRKQIETFGLEPDATPDDVLGALLTGFVPLPDNLRELFPELPPEGEIGQLDEALARLDDELLEKILAGEPIDIDALSDQQQEDIRTLASALGGDDLTIQVRKQEKYSGALGDDAYRTVTVDVPVSEADLNTVALFIDLRGERNLVLRDQAIELKNSSATLDRNNLDATADEFGLTEDELSLWLEATDIIAQGGLFGIPSTTTAAGTVTATTVQERSDRLNEINKELESSENVQRISNATGAAVTLGAGVPVAIVSLAAALGSVAAAPAVLGAAIVGAAVLTVDIVAGLFSFAAAGDVKRLEQERVEAELQQKRDDFNESSDRRDNLEREGHDPSIRDDDFSGDQNTGGNGLL